MRPLPRLLLLLAFLAQTAGFASLLNAAGYRLEYAEFQARRFGAIIAYPPALFVSYEDPANGDGRTFFTADRRARFSIYGGYNIDRRTMPALARQARERHRERGARISYDRVTDRLYVLSGTEPGARGQDEVFYEKGLFSEGGVIEIGFDIVYPAQDKSSFDPIVARMSSSFRAGKPEEMR